MLVNLVQQYTEEEIQSIELIEEEVIGDHSKSKEVDQDKKIWSD